MILEAKIRNSVKLIIISSRIEESKKLVLLGITTDKFSTFNERIDTDVVQQIINYMHYKK